MRKVRCILIDLSIVAASAVLAFLLRDFLSGATGLRDGVFIYAVVSVLCVGVCIVFSGLHRTVWRFFSFADATRLVGVVTVALLMTSFATFAFNRADDIPRSVPFIHWFLAIAMMGAARGTVRASRGHGLERRHPAAADTLEHVILVGFNHVTELYLRCVTQLAPDRIVVVGILHEESTMHGQSLGFSKVIGRPRNIAHILNQYRIHGIEIDRIVVTESFEDLKHDTRQALLAAVKSDGLTLDLFEDRLGFKAPPDAAETTPDHGGRNDRTQGELFSAGKGGGQHDAYAAVPLGYRFLKRSFDLLGALASLIVLAPLIALTAFVVALDVGPPLTFWQVRPGRFGVPFKVLKFRTMRPGYDAQGQRIPDERRQSRVGEALRRARLDELPQLVNILKGEMSFVGPRPLLPVDQPADVDIRLSVRPGLTGWAQINGGRSYLTNEEKGALDVWYVRKGSFLLDLEILARTAAFIILGEKPPRPHVLDTARDELRTVSMRRATPTALKADAGA